MFMKIAVAAIATSLTISASVSYAGPKAEVLHWWTSGGEAKSVAVLQKKFSENGGSWTDMPVAGGGGDAAMTALRARVLSRKCTSCSSTLKDHLFRNGMKKEALAILVM